MKTADCRPNSFHDRAATKRRTLPPMTEPTTLLIACGALGREVTQVIAMNGWTHLAVTCLPAKYHHTPDRIPPALQAKIRANKERYDSIFVLYGDCGTSGEIDRVLTEEGIERIAGPHCFSFFHGNDEFEATHEGEIETFYLTDFFCQHWDKFVWQSLGIDRHPSMPAFVFGNYKKIVYIAQTDNPALQTKAREIADRLGLTYEYRFRGYADLATAMAGAGDAAADGLRA